MGSNLSASVDRVTDSLVTVDTIHHQIHLGRLFEASVFVASVILTANLDVLFKTNTSVPHVRAQLSAGGSMRVSVYEATAVSDDGVAMTVVNRNRGSSAVQVSTITSAPTVTDVGNLLVDNMLAGGTSGGNRTIGSSLGTFEEFVLKRDTTYLFRAANISGATIAASMSLVFYET